MKKMLSKTASLCEPRSQGKLHLLYEHSVPVFPMSCSLCSEVSLVAATI